MANDATADLHGGRLRVPRSRGVPATLLIPLPDTLAASGERLIVPDSAQDFVGNDLAGFGACVQAFRTQLEGRS